MPATKVHWRLQVSERRPSIRGPWLSRGRRPRKKAEVFDGDVVRPGRHAKARADRCIRNGRGVTGWTLGDAPRGHVAEAGGHGSSSAHRFQPGLNVEGQLGDSIHSPKTDNGKRTLDNCKLTVVLHVYFMTLIAETPSF